MSSGRIYNAALMEKWINILFIFLFVYTAASKLFGYQLFRTTLFQSPMLADYASVLAWAIPLAEFLVAGALLTHHYRRIGAWASLLLMMVFTAYIAFMILYTPDLPCSCGGIISALTWRQHLGLNIMLTCLAIVQVLLNYKWMEMERGFAPATATRS